MRRGFVRRVPDRVAFDTLAAVLALSVVALGVARMVALG